MKRYTNETFTRYLLAFVSLLLGINVAIAQTGEQEEPPVQGKYKFAVFTLSTLAEAANHDLFTSKCQEAWESSTTYWDERPNSFLIPKYDPNDVFMLVILYPDSFGWGSFGEDINNGILNNNRDVTLPDGVHGTWVKYQMSTNDYVADGPREAEFFWEEPSIKGEWNFTLDRHYLGEYSLGQQTEVYTAVRLRDNVIMFTNSQLGNRFIAEFTAMNTLTFKVAAVDVPATYTKTQNPFVDGTNVTDAGIDPENFVFESFNATYDPAKGTITFPEGAGLAFGFANAAGEFSYYQDAFDFVSATKVVPEEPEVITYTVNEVAADIVFRTTEDEAPEGTSVTVPYRLYNVDENGNLYKKGATNKEYNYSFTLTTDGQEENIEYSATNVKNVVFLSEGEDIETLTLCTGSDAANSLIRSSNSAAAYAAEDADIVTLPAGTYKLHAVIFDASKYPDSYWVFKAGETEIANLHCTTVNIQEFDSEEFTLTEETTIVMAQAGSNKMGLDAIYIVKTDDVTIGINTVNAQSENGAVYNLLGQKVMKTQKGLYIVNGKKVVVK